MENFQCHRLLYILALKINKLLLLLLLLLFYPSVGSEMLVKEVI